MKLTSTQLRRIIKEETRKHLAEVSMAGMSRTSMASRIKSWTGEDVDIEQLDAIIEAIVNDEDIWDAISAERNETRAEKMDSL